MAKRIWTVRAKRHICPQIPEGFTVQVCAENPYDWNELYKAVKAATGVMSGGTYTKDYWEWY